MNLFELMAKISLDSSDYEKGVTTAKKSASELRSDVMKLANEYKKQGMNMSDAMKKAYSEIDRSQYETAEDSEKNSTKFLKSWNGAADKIKDVGNKIGSGLKTAAKIGTAAISAAAAGITALTKASIENYAEYEQLVGGAQLMFGKAFDTVQKNAQNAYKTVQMSQSEYLQQVNGFATGLKTALNGDEQAAAELSHRIIKAEADIVAATGNTAENVQNAFNGIMKSNFTMLDNLQIGIKPTKEGFQEVIDKVNKWKKANGEATDYQMGNLADMQSALVDYIEMVGMSDYATNEASKTISGSVASMKSAWSNLVTGIADDNADFDTLINNFVDSIGTVAENILPRVEIAFNGVSSLVEKLVPIIMSKLPTLIADFLPNLAESAIGIVESILNSVEDNKETLIETAFTVITTIANGMLDMLPQILLLGIDLLLSLAEGVTNNLDTLLPALMQTIMKIVEVLTNEENLAKLLDVALTLITELAFGLMENIDELIDAVFSIIDGIVMFLLKPESLEKLIATAIELVIAIGTGLIQAIPQLIISVLSLISSIDEQFENTDWAAIGKNVINKILDGLKRAWESVKSWFSDAWNSLFGNNEVNVDVRRRTVPDGKHRTGLDYVPFDGYIAELHKGERVLTAQEAECYPGKTIPITNNFYGGYTERDGAKIARSINRQLGLLV